MGVERLRDRGREMGLDGLLVAGRWGVRPQLKRHLLRFLH